jgi:NADH dehydrogenase FAD-containing subunit
MEPKLYILSRTGIALRLLLTPNASAKEKNKALPIEVTAISRTAQTIALHDGRILPYSKLAIATGVDAGNLGLL